MSPQNASHSGMTTTGFLNPRETSVEAAVAISPSLFAGDFSWPLLVIHRDALQHNLRVQADYCQEHGAALAPHGKTTMSPSILYSQMAAGAWGMTGATISQVRTYREFGLQRIILANQLVDPGGLQWLLEEREQHPRFECWFYVDSLAGIELLDESLRRHDGERSVGVLVEIGHEGGRTGVRDLDEAVQLAQTAAQLKRVTVGGVAGYEGTVQGETVRKRLTAVDSFLDRIREATATLWHLRLLPRGEKIIITVGGSAFFDRVIDRLSGQWLDGADIALVLRSGAYVAHDDGLYAKVDPYSRVANGEQLRPALSLWAQVLSKPEAGDAIVGFGRRDVPFDAGMPVARLVRRGNDPVEAFQECSVVRLDDHHAYVQLENPEGVNVGDLIGFGISHPCGAFDRWRVIPMVDSEYRVVDLAKTYF